MEVVDQDDGPVAGAQLATSDENLPKLKEGVSRVTAAMTASRSIATVIFVLTRVW